MSSIAPEVHLGDSWAQCDITTELMQTYILITPGGPKSKPPGFITL